DDDVGVEVVDRDGTHGREAATGIAPGRAGVVRDEQRRLRVDDGDDRRAGGGGSDDARQVERRCGRGHEGLVRLDLLRLEVDGERPVDGAYERDHSASMSATTAVARRAAATGGMPRSRAATYAIEEASPAPVGSASMPNAATRSTVPPV